MRNSQLITRDSERESNLAPQSSKPKARSSKRLFTATRLLQLVLVLFTGITMLGAGAPSPSTFNTIGHKLMCPCGCGEILLECNHVGCPDSDRMIGELRQQLSTGIGETGVLNWFAAKYGPTVLAAPIRGGFDVVAWIVPFAVLLAGLIAVFFVVRLWKQRQQPLAEAGAAHAPPLNDEQAALRERIRRETEYGE
ncbi:cytochrome c-type biogenesis protein CcmH [Granulicella cerasi]|uniref:cytochrome c-type biogenesis protein CcmH n=1 Tax=Granulicella cerasi TaxID=741063 RepID=UPI0021DFC5F7|nr:cytochrome c-type biogenesis protein CcmH [Granulicella cerasi]